MEDASWAQVEVDRCIKGDVFDAFGWTGDCGFMKYSKFEDFWGFKGVDVRGTRSMTCFRSHR